MYYYNLNEHENIKRLIETVLSGPSALRGGPDRQEWTPPSDGDTPYFDKYLNNHKQNF
jgi:hypothetical protein